MRAPDLLTLAWHGWVTAWGLDVAALLAGVLYVVCAHRLVGRWPWRRTAAFLAGIAVVVVALQSGIDGEDDRLLSDHMVQHLLLLELAPLLLLAGRPGILGLRSAPRDARPGLARRLRRLRPLTHPASCLVILCAVVAGTHVPAFYDATLRHPALHELEHAAYLVAGALMWWPILDGDPMPGHRLDGFGRLAYVVAAMLPMTVLGAWLNRATSVVYPAYVAPAKLLGVSAVADQQHAGAIMWVLGSSLMVVAGLWQAMAALIAEERHQQLREQAALHRRERVP